MSQIGELMNFATTILHSGGSESFHCTEFFKALKSIFFNFAFNVVLTIFTKFFFGILENRKLITKIGLVKKNWNLKNLLDFLLIQRHKYRLYRFSCKEAMFMTCRQKYIFHFLKALLCLYLKQIDVYLMFIPYLLFMGTIIFIIYLIIFLEICISTNLGNIYKTFLITIKLTSVSGLKACCCMSICSSERERKTSL